MFVVKKDPSNRLTYQQMIDRGEVEKKVQIMGFTGGIIHREGCESRKKVNPTCPCELKGPFQVMVQSVGDTEGMLSQGLLSYTDVVKFFATPM